LSEDKPSRRHLNQSQKRGLRAGDIATFVRQYGRKAQKNTEPNDRGFKEEAARKVKRMDPLELDRLMR
jgi:hypothetical protein